MTAPTGKPPQHSPDLAAATRLVGAGRRAEWTQDERLGGGIVNPPVWRASTILYENVAELNARPRDTHDKLFYGRRGTPTVWALADALTQMEPEAQGTLLYPSGVAAISAALLALAEPGAEFLVVDTAYEPTRSLCDGLLARMGVQTRYFDPRIGAGVAELISDATRLMVLESPGSLTFEVQDIPAITAVARAAAVPTMIDNTWATPLLLPALGMGVDISMMSLTKYVGGHSDLLMGSLTANAALWPRLRDVTFQLGHSVSADDCALALRGLRTLDVRLQRHGQSALAVAQWLSIQPQVGVVLHPALPDHPDHALFCRDFRGASGLFAFTLRGADKKGRARFVDALELFGIGYSWGGFESLAVPADPPRSVRPWQADGPLVRLSIGLEDPQDLIADLDRAFATAGLA